VNKASKSSADRNARKANGHAGFGRLGVFCIFAKNLHSQMISTKTEKKMGGRGSGRRPGDGGKAETKSALALEIKKLTRLKLLVPEKRQFWHWPVRDRAVRNLSVKVEPGGMMVFCHLKDSDQVIQQWVGTQTTPCTLGGHRYWFTCPRCDRRVAILYRVNKDFACRYCHVLAYACQKEGAGGSGDTTGGQDPGTPEVGAGHRARSW
jgi:hypothetical protein